MTTTPTPLFRTDEEDTSQPTSARIRARLTKANRRFHANDNISAFVREGELDQLRAEVATKMADVLSLA